MMRRRDDDTRVEAAPPPRDALAGLAALAFASSASLQPGAGRHLAFLPLDTLELDLEDPQQRDFGDYELRAQLGQGGMGVVYRAWQRSLQREVAIKLLSAGPWASPEFVERFRREAQSAARLQHPNIVPIHEIGQHAELNFFSMGLVRGESLAQRLDRDGPLPPREAARLLRVIAEALDYAHRLGILHLDLKPANVLLDEHGEPRVADFGLARRLDESLASDGDEVSGTPAYMAPEQATARSQRIGVATDIYGLGAILYELLTGRPPFLGATARQTLELVVSREVESPRRHDRRIPEDLAAICAHCLAKEPAQRYVTARGLAEDLQRYLEGRAVSVRPLGTGQRIARWARREPRVAFAAAAAVLALLLGLVATALQWRRAEQHAIAARENLWQARNQAAQAALAEGDGFRGLRPLAANLAEMEAAGRLDDAARERRRIGTVLANAPQVRSLSRLPQGLSITSVAVSPDGSRYAIATHASDGARRVVQYATADDRELWSTSTDGLTNLQPFAHGYYHGALRYSPDGTRLVATLPALLVLPAPAYSDAIALDAATGAVLAPPPGPPHADIVWSDDARVALVRWRSVPAIRFPDAAQFYEVGSAWRAIGPRHEARLREAGSAFLPTPDGALWLGTNDSETLGLHEKGSFTTRWTLRLPAGDPVRAWRFSRDARHLALGTIEGRVHLVDVADGRLETLPALLAATVRGLEFDAGGATVFAQAEDGALVAWDVATRRPRAAPLAMQRVQPESRLVIAGDAAWTAVGNELRAWTLTPASPFDNAALAAPARPRSRRFLHAYAFDLHAPSRQLVSGGGDGTRVRWTLPPAVVLPAGAAPLPPSTQGFDGRHLVAVDGRDAWRMRPDGRADGPRWRHPEPVRIAELTHDGRRLVTVAGRTLRVFDTERGTLHGTPLVLPQTPLRVDLASRAPVLLLATADYAGGRLREQLHFADLERTAWLGAASTVDGPLQQLELAADGRNALAVQVDAASGATRVQWIAADGSPPPCQLPSDLPPASDSVLAADGRHAWLQAALPRRLVRLERWDLARCTAVARHEFPGPGRMMKLRARGDDVVASGGGTAALTWFGADGGQRAAGTAIDGGMFEFALDRDGRLAAFATRGAAQVFDARSGERLSAPLAAPIAGTDAIAKLAFSPDGERLVARTVRGRWLSWPVPAATQSVETIQALARFLDPAAQEAPVPEAELQSALALAVPAPASLPASTPQVIELPAAPADAPDPRYVPVDLAAAINVPLNGPWPRARATGGDLPTLAPGAQRLLGIDWRIDGGVQLSGGGAAVTIHPLHARSAPVALPGVAARRLHLLAWMHIPLPPRAAPHPFVHAVLRDADGREERFTVRQVEHVATHAMPDRAAATARTAWVGVSSTHVREGSVGSSQTPSHLYAVAFDVPPGFGPVASLQFEVPGGQMDAPLLFAATLERGDPG